MQAVATNQLNTHFEVKWNLPHTCSTLTPCPVRQQSHYLRSKELFNYGDLALGQEWQFGRLLIYSYAEPIPFSGCNPAFLNEWTCSPVVATEGVGRMCGPGVEISRVDLSTNHLCSVTQTSDVNLELEMYHWNVQSECAGMRQMTLILSYH